MLITGNYHVTDKINKIEQQKSGGRKLHRTAATTNNNNRKTYQQHRKALLNISTVTTNRLKSQMRYVNAKYLC